MTQTPNLDQMTTPELLAHIAAEATTYADDYFNQPPVGGELGKKWDRQAAQDRSLAAAAEVASKTLRNLQSGTHVYGREATS